MTRSPLPTSLYSYDIAEDLGGWEALEHLRYRALGRGTPSLSRHGPKPHGHRPQMGDRASRLVPVAAVFARIPVPDSRAKTCATMSVWRVILEDHYYNHSDAAVVFKRTDHWAGESASSTMATTAPLFPGTTPPNWILLTQKCAKPSSRPSCTWRVTSRSSGSMRL